MLFYLLSGRKSQ